MQYLLNFNGMLLLHKFPLFLKLTHSNEPCALKIHHSRHKTYSSIHRKYGYSSGFKSDLLCTLIFGSIKNNLNYT